GDAVAVLIHRHKCQVGRAGVAAAAGQQGLGIDFDAHLHRSIEGTVDAGLEHDQFPDVDGEAKVHVVNGSGHGHAAAVAGGGDGATQVHQMHDAAAEDVADDIGVVGQHNLGHL